MFRSRCFICAESKQDTGTEIVEVTISIGDTFQYLDRIVAAFGEVIEIEAIKRIKDIRLPVANTD